MKCWFRIRFSDKAVQRGQARRCLEGLTGIFLSESVLLNGSAVFVRQESEAEEYFLCPDAYPPCCDFLSEYDVRTCDKPERQGLSVAVGSKSLLYQFYPDSVLEDYASHESKLYRRPVGSHRTDVVPALCEHAAGPT